MIFQPHLVIDYKFIGQGGGCYNNKYGHERIIYNIQIHIIHSPSNFSKNLGSISLIALFTKLIYVWYL